MDGWRNTTVSKIGLRFAGRLIAIGLSRQVLHATFWIITLTSTNGENVNSKCIMFSGSVYSMPVTRCIRNGTRWIFYR